MSLYLIANGPMPTTAAQAVVTTGTAIKTLLQVKPFNIARIVEWGISFDGSAAATPIKVELLETDVAATVTASADADIAKFGPGVADQAVASVAGLTLGTTATGYTSTAEGTITSVRMFDSQLIAPTSQYVKQFPLGREPVIQIAKFGRIRVTAGAAVNAYCYMILDI
jgi:hypothetical protein